MGENSQNFSSNPRDLSPVMVLKFFLLSSQLVYYGVMATSSCTPVAFLTVVDKTIHII